MLLEPLVSTIETIKERIATHGTALRENETRTRMALIDPLLQALGWDTSDPSMVLPEFDVSGRKADYALLERGGSPAATVEAKKLGEPLASHRMQMLNYSNASGVEFASLTDGDKWELYEVFKRGQLEERRVLDVSIADAPAHEAALKLLLLWRPNLATGQPVAASDPILDSLRNQAVVSEPVYEHATTAQLQIPDSESNWIPLGKISPSEVRLYGKPNAVRFSDGDIRETRNWRWVLREITEWLIRTDKLTSAQCPIQKIPFINAEPVSYTGKPFRNFVQLPGGLYFTADWRLDVLVRLSQRFLTHYNIDPVTVELRFE